MASAEAILLPPDNIKWTTNDPRTWPTIAYEDLVDYLLASKAYDGKAMKSFRALYAYNYVQNGWLGDILCTTSDNIYFLKANVSPSQPGVGRSDYQAWVAVTSDSTIKTGHCTCPAGEGRSCSHISAIVYAVILAWNHGIAGKTCTDKERVWGRGAQKASLQENFEDIDFKTPKPDATPLLKKTTSAQDKSQLPKIKQFLDHSDIIKHAKESCSNPLWKIKGTMICKIVNAKERTIVQREPLNQRSHDDIDVTRPVKDFVCQPCKDFYQAYVDISLQNKNNITRVTSEQTTVVWQDARKLRISSSKVNALPKTSRADPNKFVINQIYPRFKGNSATQHGLKREVEARSWFEKTNGLKVLKSGIVIDEEEPYLAASPDGIIDDSTISEIKCPTKSLQELVQSGKWDVSMKDGDYCLNPKGRNGYYTQIQIAMFCTKRAMCKFVVWTPVKAIIIDVPYDSVFVSPILERVRKFYFKHLLVRLADENHSKRLKLSDEYKQCCRQ